jgi:hypothetical protein
VCPSATCVLSLNGSWADYSHSLSQHPTPPPAAVGKWHLGFHQKAFTPEARGFDTAYGYYTGNEEYWNHTSPCWGCGNYTALDLHRATATTFEAVTNESMHYSTELFSSELIKLIEAHPDPTGARTLARLPACPLARLPACLLFRCAHACDALCLRTTNVACGNNAKNL